MMVRSRINMLILIYFLFIGISIGQKVLTVEFGIINSTIQSKNIPNLNPSDINNYFVTAGYGFDLSEKFTFTTDLRFATKGYDRRFGENQLDIEIHNFEYLSVIPTIAFRPSSTISLETGLSYGIKLRERSREVSLQTGSWYNNQNINNYEFGILMAAKLHYQFMFFKLAIERSLLNINDSMFTDETGMIIPNTSIKNSSFMIGVGFYFWG